MLRRLAPPLAVVAAILGLAAPACAMDRTVTKTADTNDGTCDSDCSLREAVAAAQPGDTVVVPASASHYALDSHISIAQSLTISGGGAASTVIDASGSSDRDFSISAGDVTFQGVTVTGGSAGLPGGGGIFRASSSGSLTLVDSVVTGNSASSTAASFTGAGGGGILSAASGGLTLTRSSVTKNTVSFSNATSSFLGGGGVLVAVGPLTATDSHVDDNEVTVTGALDRETVCCDGAGGILRDASAGLTLTRSTVSRNQATVTNGGASNGGGGIYSNGGANPFATTTLTQSHVDGNTLSVTGPAATTTDDKHCCSGGGAILTGNGLVMKGGTTSRNTATIVAGDCCQGGGGVYDVANARAIAIARATLTRNTLKLTGGGAHSGGGALIAEVTADTLSAAATPVSLAASTVSGNSARIGGGATGSGGGGFHLATGDVNRLTNSTFSGNSTNAAGSSQGGGALFLGPGRKEGGGDRLANVTIAGNAAPKGAGGGILSEASKVRTSNSIVALNAASAGHDCAGVSAFRFASIGHNLENAPSTCRFTAAGDRVLPTAAALHLGPLAANGGPTLTRALFTGSPAINGGNPAGCRDTYGHVLHVDERGVHRPFGPRCDVGAFEAQIPRDTKLALDPDSFRSGKGTTVSYRDTFPARTTLTVLRQSSSNQLVRVGSFTHQDKAGLNSFHWNGKVAGSALAAGKYWLAAQPTFHGARGPLASASFKVTK